MLRFLISACVIVVLIGCESDDIVHPAPSVVTTVTMLTPEVEACEPVEFVIEVTKVSDEPVMIEYCLCGDSTRVIFWGIEQITGEPPSTGGIVPADPPCWCRIPPLRMPLASHESIIRTVHVEPRISTITKRIAGRPVSMSCTPGRET